MTGKRLPRIEASSKNKQTARARFEEKLAEYERTGKLKTKKSPLLKDWLDRWLREFKQPNVKPRTYDSYRGDVHGISAILGHVRVAEITTSHIRQLEREVLQTRSSKTAFNYYQRLKNALADAINDGLIDSNPCERVSPPRVEANPTSILEGKQPEQLTAQVEQKEPIGGSHHPFPDTPEEKAMWALMWQLAFNTGMRQAERFALMPFQLIEESGIPGIYVCQELQRYKSDVEVPRWLKATQLEGNFWIVPPKSKKGIRFVPLQKDLWDALKQWAQEHNVGGKELIFTRKTHPLTNLVERRRWYRTLEAAGLPRVTIRSARHYYATKLLRAGVPEDVRKAIMGHVSLGTTAGYTHYSADILAQLVGMTPTELQEIESGDAVIEGTLAA